MGEGEMGRGRKTEEGRKRERDWRMEVGVGEGLRSSVFQG